MAKPLLCKVLREKGRFSEGPKCTSKIRKSAVIGLRFFPLTSADVRGAGTREEPLRTSVWEAMPRLDYELRNDYGIFCFPQALTPPPTRSISRKFS